MIGRKEFKNALATSIQQQCQHDRSKTRMCHGCSKNTSAMEMLDLHEVYEISESHRSGNDTLVFNHITKAFEVSSGETTMSNPFDESYRDIRTKSTPTEMTRLYAAMLGNMFGDKITNSQLLKNPFI